MIDLSICLIVKNEEKHIEKCLSSIIGKNLPMNEILILDTGSIDRTIEILKNYPEVNLFEKIFEPFDFSKARNFLLRKSLGKWILILDADEELPEESIEKINDLIDVEQNIAIVNDIVSFIRNEKFSFQQIRLFKNNPKVKYVNEVHEQIFPSLHKLGYNLLYSGIEIYHYGYNCSNWVLRNKANRNIELLLSMQKKKSHWLISMQLGQTYIVKNDRKLALKYLNEALSFENIPIEYKNKIESTIKSL